MARAPSWSWFMTEFLREEVNTGSLMLIVSHLAAQQKGGGGTRYKRGEFLPFPPKFSQGDPSLLFHVVPGPVSVNDHYFHSLSLQIKNNKKKHSVELLKGKDKIRHFQNLFCAFTEHEARRNLLAMGTPSYPFQLAL